VDKEMLWTYSRTDGNS